MYSHLNTNIARVNTCKRGDAQALSPNSPDTLLRWTQRARGWGTLKARKAQALTRLMGGEAVHDAKLGPTQLVAWEIRDIRTEGEGGPGLRL